MPTDSISYFRFQCYKLLGRCEARIRLVAGGRRIAVEDPLEQLSELNFAREDRNSRGTGGEPAS